MDSLLDLLILGDLNSYIYIYIYLSHAFGSLCDTLNVLMPHVIIQNVLLEKNTHFFIIPQHVSFSEHEATRLGGLLTCSTGGYFSVFPSLGEKCIGQNVVLWSI